MTHHAIGSLPEVLLEKHKWYMRTGCESPLAAAVLVLAEVQAIQALPSQIRLPDLGLEGAVDEWREGTEIDDEDLDYLDFALFDEDDYEEPPDEEYNEALRLFQTGDKPVRTNVALTQEPVTDDEPHEGDHTGGGPVG